LLTTQKAVWDQKLHAISIRRPFSPKVAVTRLGRRSSPRSQPARGCVPARKRRKPADRRNHHDLEFIFLAGRGSGSRSASTNRYPLRHAYVNAATLAKKIPACPRRLVQRRPTIPDREGPEPFASVGSRARDERRGMFERDGVRISHLPTASARSHLV
jgi:hypothetical protein